MFMKRTKTSKPAPYRFWILGNLGVYSLTGCCLKGLAMDYFLDDYNNAVAEAWAVYEKAETEARLVYNKAEKDKVK